MRRLWTTLVILGVLTSNASATPALTHDQDRSPLPARSIPAAQDAILAPELWVVDAEVRQAELDRWVQDFSAWKEWLNRWGNRREPGWFGDFSKRRPRPDPPAWLLDRCRHELDERSAMTDACALVAEWRADYATAQAITARTATVQRENVDKITWWEHVHLDVAWPAMQSGSSIFGVVGVHATTSVRGRLQIFVAPGAMLLNVPTRYGGRAWKLAANYGIAFRLGQFAFPGRRQALLHVNLAKAWLLSAGPDVPTKSTDFVGFSITFKKTQPSGQ